MPSAFPVMCLAGMKHIEAAVTQRAQARNIPFDEALVSMPRKELFEAAIEGMPPAVREAFLNGQRVTALRQQQRQFEQPETKSGPLMALGTEAMNTQNRPSLSPSEHTAAQRVFAQIAAPLTTEQLDVCAKLGMTPEAFKQARDTELSASLPGGAHGLTDGEREVCGALGMSEADYAAEKKRLASG
jgi:phage I-like protein